MYLSTKRQNIILLFTICPMSLWVMTLFHFFLKNQGIAKINLILDTQKNVSKIVSKDIWLNFKH